jgi:hypothetical protein
MRGILPHGARQRPKHRTFQVIDQSLILLKQLRCRPDDSPSIPASFFRSRAPCGRPVTTAPTASPVSVANRLCAFYPEFIRGHLPHELHMAFPVRTSVPRCLHCGCRRYPRCRALKLRSATAREPNHAGIQQISGLGGGLRSIGRKASAGRPFPGSASRKPAVASPAGLHHVLRCLFQLRRRRAAGLDRIPHGTPRQRCSP